MIKQQNEGEYIQFNLNKLSRYIKGQIEIKHEDYLMIKNLIANSSHEDQTNQLVMKTQQNIMPSEIISTFDYVSEMKYLKISHIRKLAPKNMLNDEIISSYIELINLFIIQPFEKNKLKFRNKVKLVKPYIVCQKVLNQNSIKNFFDKNNISNESILLIALCFSLHWVLVVFIKKSIILFDSLNKKNKQKYMKMNNYANLKQIFQILYTKDLNIQNIHICEEYPMQSQKTNDCGVFVLQASKSIIFYVIKTLIQTNQIDYEKIKNDLIYKSICQFDPSKMNQRRYKIIRQLMLQSLLMDGYQK